MHKFVNRPTKIPDVIELTPVVHTDPRGAFSEVYNRGELAKLGIDTDFVQDNQSVSSRASTVRGLHFQLPPYAQAKLVRVVKGAAFDVAVDLRPKSPTFGKWCSAILKADEWRQLFIPAGFAHGFCTLEPETIMLYKIDAPYSQEHERGILWSDPELAIDWPVDKERAILSEKDRNLPPLKDISPILRCLLS